ncbi:MAG: response regulator [Pirellulales bacterium]
MSKRVLVCDDSLIMRTLVSDCLAADGWEIVATACDGRDAFQKYQTHRPDAVTIDVVMPEYDGLYGLEKILEFDPAAKVVVLSALDQPKLIGEAVRRGAQDFLVKPFLPDQLKQSLTACVCV